MIESPEIRYVRSGDASLAWQVVGDGPVDVVEVPGIFTHLESKWEEPGLARWVSDVARFSRLILFDRRGIGLSDRIAGDEAPSLRELAGDIAAVLDAAGSREAVLVGVGDGGKIAAAFAGLHPERTRALVLYNSTALQQEWNPDLAYIGDMLAAVETGWGSGIMAGRMGNDALRAYFARAERRACTPHAAASMLRRAFEEDIGDLLASIRAPTVVQHFTGHTGPAQLPVVAERAAAAIPGARLLGLPDYTPDAQVRERRGLAAAIEELVTGRVSVGDDDRVLAAVLFTDIVGSTEKTAELGDRRWKELLDEHDRLAARAAEAARGRIVKGTGDGVLACFDGAARAMSCARALAADAARLGMPVRVGIHVGDCERRGDDIGGMTVNIAARVLAQAGANEVVVTSTVAEALVGTGLRFEPAGRHELRGVPGTWKLFRAS